MRQTNKILRFGVESISRQPPALVLENLNAWFHEAHVLRDLTASFPERTITCVVGPSGSGKSTLLRSINRINDEVDGFTAKGKAIFFGRNLYEKSVKLTQLRRDIGMVFQKPRVFPTSIAENVLFGLRGRKKLSKIEKIDIIEKNLRAVALWREVSHRLTDNAFTLSVGQQQRLCLARTLAVDPKVLLLDEVTSSLDPVSTRAIEELLQELKQRYTIVFVTHNIRQAERIADNLIFMCEGKVIEGGSAKKLFSNPDNKQTANYLNDEFCEC